VTLRSYWLGAGFGFIALVIYLSLNTDHIDAGRVEDVKVGHFIAYGWLMLWFAQLFPAQRQRLVIALGFVALGIALEYAQGMTGYRSFAYSDMRDNGIGVLAGWVIALTPLGRAMPALEAHYGRRRGTNTAAT